MAARHLYGLTTNCCDKDQCSEKVANVLLPMSYGMYAEATMIPIVLCTSAYKANVLETTFHAEGRFETEKACIHPDFQLPPPNDICMTHGETTTYFECKVVMYKSAKTELILRQDCYAFNCLQHILLANKTKYPDAAALLADASIQETPYLWMLVWKPADDVLVFDCIVFTDVAILRMIRDAATSRSREALKLVDRALHQHFTDGTMSYKESKQATVAHQKVSLFPWRDIPCLQSTTFEFRVKSTDLVFQSVRSDTNLWQEIEKSRLCETIRALRLENAELKAKLE